MVIERASASHPPPPWPGFFLSFLKIRLIGFGGGLAVIAPIRALGATTYATPARAVLTFIFAKPVDNVRLFKETFRMIMGEE